MREDGKHKSINRHCQTDFRRERRTVPVSTKLGVWGPTRASLGDGGRTCWCAASVAQAVRSAFEDDAAEGCACGGVPWYTPALHCAVRADQMTQDREASRAGSSSRARPSPSPLQVPVGRLLGRPGQAVREAARLAAHARACHKASVLASGGRRWFERIPPGEGGGGGVGGASLGRT